MESTTVAILGGGPAGVMLGLLLARLSVQVVVLEKHADFLRDFRGDAHAQRLIVIPEWLRAKEPLDAQRERLDKQLRQLSGRRVLSEGADQGASRSAT